MKKNKYIYAFLLLFGATSCADTVSYTHLTLPTIA